MKLTPFTTVLENGAAVRIREVGPGDRLLLAAGFEQLSGRSRHFRFLAAHQRLTDAELDRFTASNNADHVAVGALTEDDASAQPLGIARYIRLPRESHAAEIAVTVVDSHQGLGLGTLLLGVLAKFAGLNGISEFVALVHHDNKPMRGLLDRLGGVSHRIGGAEIEVRVPLAPDPVQYPRSSVGDTFRAVYPLAKIR